MPSLEEFCRIEGDLGMQVIGQAPIGMRIDFPFEGTAIGPHWDGERPVRGIDYVTIRGDGNMDLEIHGVIGEKRESIAYSATGVSVVNEDQSANPKELIVFQTGNEEFGWLNNEVAVAFGTAASGKLTLEIFIARP